MTESFLQLPTMTVLYFHPIASKFYTISMGFRPRSLAVAGTESASIADMPKSSVLFHATINEKNVKVESNGEKNKAKNFCLRFH